VDAAIALWVNFASMIVSLPLFLSDVAGSEILLIMVFVLIFFGSKSIPGIARTMGRTIRQIKDASQEVQDEIRKSGAEMRSDFNLQKIVDDTRNDIEKPFREHARTLDQAVNFEPPRNFVNPPVPQFDKPAVPSEDEVNESDTEKKDTAGSNDQFDQAEEARS
jgi:sec-independent protein translocase protein TatA